MASGPPRPVQIAAIARFARGRLARFGREAPDEPRQRRIANLARQRGERHRRIAQRVAHVLIPRIAGGRRSQRLDGQPGRDEQRRDDPDVTSSCRHGPTLSHPTRSANFWLLASRSPPREREVCRRVRIEKLLPASWYRKTTQTGPELLADAPRRSARRGHDDRARLASGRDLA